MTCRFQKPVTFFSLFASFLKIGSSTFGGGFAMIPIIQREIVDNHQWMSPEDFVDMLAVTQAAPGPVAVNSAVFAGYRLKGLKGALAALFGTVLPSFIIILLFAMLIASQGQQAILQKFFNGVRPAVAALILGAAFNMGRQALHQRFDILAALAALILLLLFRVHPIILIILGALAGILYSKKLPGQPGEER